MISSIVGGALALYFTSILSCYLPKALMKFKAVRFGFPFLTILTAGLQLSIVIVDMIPHMLEEPSHNASPNPGHSHHHHHHHNHHHEFFPLMAAGLMFIMLLAVDILILHRPSKEINRKIHDHKRGRVNANLNKKAHTDSDENHSDHEHTHCGGNIGTCNTAAIAKTTHKSQAIVILLAISAHSFFEGFSVPQKSASIFFCLGLAMHKVLESFAVGASILSSTFSTWVSFCMITFYSLLTPCGMLLADTLTKLNKSVIKWFNALSLGSLMFVVFIEMIAHSFHTQKHQKEKLALLTAGYLIGCAVIYNAH